MSLSPLQGITEEGICCCCLVTQSCPTLCDPMDYSMPDSSVLGIFQARILEWVAISFSRGSSWPRDWTSHLHYRQLLHCLKHQRSIWPGFKSSCLGIYRRIFKYPNSTSDSTPTTSVLLCPLSSFTHGLQWSGGSTHRPTSGSLCLLVYVLFH